MATPRWSWDKIPNSVGAGKNDPPSAKAMDGYKSLQKERLGKMGLIDKNSVVGPQINNELTV